MFRFGVTLTALVLLFLLTAVALRAVGRLQHLYLVGATLAAGVALIMLG